MAEPNTTLWLMTQIPPLAVVVASFAGFVPTAAALVAIIWYVILIWESRTISLWRAHRAIKKLNKLKAREITLRALIQRETPEDLSESPISDSLKTASKP